MKSLVYSISFLFSFFLTVSIYLLYHLRPNKQEGFDTSTPQYQNKLPAYDDNFLLLTTYQNKDKIVLSEKRWYDYDTSKSDSDSLAYFTYNTPLQFSTYNKYVEIAKLKDTELLGPVAFKFANDEVTFELSEFSILFMIKFNEITGRHTIFELLGNTISKDDTVSTAPTYIPNRISLEINKKSASEIDLYITIGDDVQVTSALANQSYINGKPILIALCYNKNDVKQVRFKIDTFQTSSYSLQKVDKITLGSSPIIINKGGELDCDLLSMGFYKKSLTDNELSQFVDFNNYYINGFDSFASQANANQNSLAQADLNNRENKNKINNLNKLLQKCIASKIPESSSTITQTLPRFSISQIPIPSKISKSK